MKKLLIHLESNVDRLPIQFQLVQCPTCAYYLFLELNLYPGTARCPNASCTHQDQGLVIVDCSPDKDHRFVGWGWETTET